MQIAGVEGGYMSDYIEREAAQSAVWEEDNQTDMILAISSLPAADVAPVIRCEECRYYQNAKINKKGFLICPASGMEITEDDYCSYGERKGGNT